MRERGDAGLRYDGNCNHDRVGSGYPRCHRGVGDRVYRGLVGEHTHGDDDVCRDKVTVESGIMRHQYIARDKRHECRQRSLENQK